MCIAGACEVLTGLTGNPRHMYRLRAQEMQERLRQVFECVVTTANSIAKETVAFPMMTDFDGIMRAPRESIHYLPRHVPYRTWKLPLAPYLPLIWPSTKSNACSRLTTSILLALLK
jgi:hypothetical protein